MWSYRLPMCSIRKGPQPRQFSREAAKTCFLWPPSGPCNSLHTHQVPLVPFKFSGTLPTGFPSIPSSPGWFVPLAIPWSVLPESDATGASPGLWPSVWPGAFGAPSPCSMILSTLYSCNHSMREGILREIRTRSFPFEKLFACGLASWCFRHCGDIVLLLRFLFLDWNPIYVRRSGGNIADYLVGILVFAWCMNAFLHFRWQTSHMSSSLHPQNRISLSTSFPNIISYALSLVAPVAYRYKELGEGHYYRWTMPQSFPVYVPSSSQSWES